MVDPSRSFGAGRPMGLGRGLAEAARVAVRECLGIAADERVLVITNPDPDVSSIAFAVHDAAVAVGADAVVLVQPPKGDADVAHPEVLRALETEPDVVATITSGPLGGDPERIRRPVHGTYTHYFQYLIGEARSRGFWAPGADRRTFARTVPVDYGELTAHAAALRDLLREAVELRITGAAGTELAVAVDGAKTAAEDGRYLAPGQGGNLPAGEVVVPVLPETASGRLVVDATLGLPGGSRTVRERVTLTVEAGTVTRVDGGDDAQAVQQVLAGAARLADQAVTGGWLTRSQAKVYGANARRIAEVGIGLNPAARLSGNILVDDKVRGSAHIGIGAASHERPPGAPIQVDAVLRRPRVVAVLEDGSEAVLVADGGAPVPTNGLALAR